MTVLVVSHSGLSSSALLRTSCGAVKIVLTLIIVLATIVFGAYSIANGQFFTP
jgi:hypothetical protein